MAHESLTNFVFLQIVCMIISDKGVEERPFTCPSANGRQTLYFCTTSTFFWSTRPRSLAEAAQTKSAEVAEQSAGQTAKEVSSSADAMSSGDDVSR